MAEETGKLATPLPVAVGEQNHDELLTKMEETRKKWMEDDGEDADDTDRLLNEAIEMAVQQGRGWSPGEKESYMAKILDDDFIPPIFAENMEELEKTGLAEAFSSLQYDDSPSIIMLDLKKKGTDAFLNGKRSQVNNVQYYRDAINHYYEAFAWAQRIEPIEHQGQTQTVKPELATDDPQFKEAELDEIKSNLCANAALAHMHLKNWGYVREDSKKVSGSAVKLPEKRGILISNPRALVTGFEF
jgi:hypothetical protein